MTEQYRDVHSKQIRNFLKLPKQFRANK